MRLLMAVSADGFTARSQDDDMTWTGHSDKALFRVLTSVGGLCAVGSKTGMPILKGRTVLRVTRTPKEREDVTLEEIYRRDRYNPGGIWLLGGAAVALSAFEQGMLDEVHLSRVPVNLATPGTWSLMLPWADQIGHLLKSTRRWELVISTPYGNVTHEVWRCRLMVAV